VLHIFDERFAEAKEAFLLASMKVGSYVAGKRATFPERATSAEQANPNYSRFPLARNA